METAVYNFVSFIIVSVDVILQQGWWWWLIDLQWHSTKVLFKLSLNPLKIRPLPYFKTVQDWSRSCSRQRLHSCKKFKLGLVVPKMSFQRLLSRSNYLLRGRLISLRAQGHIYIRHGTVSNRSWIPEKTNI